MTLDYYIDKFKKMSDSNTGCAGINCTECENEAHDVYLLLSELKNRREQNKPIVLNQAEKDRLLEVLKNGIYLSN